MGWGQPLEGWAEQEVEKSDILLHAWLSEWRLLNSPPLACFCFADPYCLWFLRQGKQIEHWAPLKGPESRRLRGLLLARALALPSPWWEEDLPHEFSICFLRFHVTILAGDCTMTQLLSLKSPFWCLAGQSCQIPFSDNLKVLVVMEKESVSLFNKTNSQFIYLSIFQFIYLTTYLSTCPSIRPSSLSIHPSIILYIYLPICLSIYLSVSVFSSVQSLSHIWLFVTPWTAARQASLSITNSWSLLKFMSIKSVISSNHLILCHHLLLLPSIFTSIRVFSNESVLHIRYQSTGASASASVLPMNTQDWFPLGWTGWICLQSKGLSRVFSNITQFKSINSSALNLLYGPTLTSIHDYWKNHSFD